jgi:hypothetical protein
LLDDELARAVRTESAAALCFWWRVSRNVVKHWRKFLDVTRTNNARTHELIKAAALEGAAMQQVRVWTDAEREAKRQTAKRLDLGRTIWHGYQGPRWTAAEMKLLGKLSDADVAARIRRTVEAVRQQSNLAGLPPAKDGRRRER